MGKKKIKEVISPPFGDLYDPPSIATPDLFCLGMIAH